jgi:hypothetical protein
MRRLRHAALFVSGLPLIILVGCAGNVDPNDIHVIGHAEVVFVRPASNFSASGAGGAAPSPAGAVAAGMTIFLNDYANNKEASSLQARAADISALNFDDQLYSQFSTVIAATPWLSGTTIKTVSGADIKDEGDYTRSNTADSVIYLEPVFYTIPGNQFFNLDVRVLIQRADKTGTNHVVHTVAKQEFTFRHHLSLVKPGMSWAQQKDLAHEVAAMNFDQALNAWLNDDAALMRAAFSQDQLQIDQSLRAFFGDVQKAPGG